MAPGCRNEGLLVDLKKGYYVPLRWNMTEVANRFGGSLRPSTYDARIVYFADSYRSLYCVLYYIIANNVIPKKGERNELKRSDLYFLDVMFTEDAQGIPFSRIIISYMRRVAHS